MKRYLYLSLLPEALIASMLPPDQFGSYLAVGTKKRTRGQAMFFEVDINFNSDYFDLDKLEELCIPHDDGSPKRSKYFSIYRVLEHIPLDKLKNLYLATDDGRVLELKRGEYTEKHDSKLRLYQQICPVNPRIASSLNPKEFINFITDSSNPVSVPKIVFVQLGLNSLAIDPVNGSDENLPFPNIQHLRDCLVELKIANNKPTKTVIRFMQGDLLYRTIKNGFFVGDKDNFIFYEFPSLDKLENEYYSWWRSALVLGFR
jgi:hypothetical protein